MQFETSETMTQWLKDHGVDVRNFNKVGLKTLCQLWEETERREVTLEWDEKNQRVLRVASSVRVIVTACDGRYTLRETKREYPPTLPYLRFLNRACNQLFQMLRIGTRDIFYRSVDRDAWWTMSETQIKGERSESAAIRGLREECGIFASEDELDTRYSELLYRELIPVETYRSSTYPGIWSSVYIAWVGLKLRDKPWDEPMKVVIDGDVKIHVALIDNYLREPVHICARDLPKPLRKLLRERKLSGGRSAAVFFCIADISRLCSVAISVSMAYSAATMSQDQLIKLSCSKCGRINYWSRKNRKTVEKKIELKKFCKWCRAQTVHKEAKK